MSRPSTPAEAVIIPVSGVANFGHGRVSTAAIHFKFLRECLQRRTGAAVEQPIIPAHLGLYGALERTYSRFEAETEATFNRYPADMTKLLIGHSLGGILAQRFVATHPEVNMISVASPHGPLRHRLGYGPLNHRVDEINEFVQTTPHVQPEREGGPRIAQVGPLHDELVPLDAALQRIPFSTPRHHILARHGARIPAGYPDARVHRTLLPDEHISIMTMPEPALILTGIAKATLERSAVQPLTAFVL